MAVYDIEGNVISDVSVKIQSVIGASLRYSAWLHSIVASDSDGSVQGACTDGSYIYYVCTSANKIKKYNLSTGQTTAVSYTSGLYGHANDMTYNPNTGKLYLTVMDNDATIYVINPSTLAPVSHFSLTDGSGNVIPNHGIAYDRVNNRYIVANATVITGTYGQRYSLFDSNFTFIKTIVMPQPETHTIQGIETDGYLIYRALWDSTNHVNYVSVYDYDGNAYRVVTVGDSGELETLMNDWNGNWYMNFNSGKIVACDLFNNSPMEIVELITA